MAKVLVTPRSFGTYSQEPYELLKRHHIEVVEAPQKGILSKAELLRYIDDVDGIIAGVDTYDAAVLSAAKNLKVISKYGVGIDNIDVEYCKDHSIDVFRAVGANSEAVADYAFALILGVSRRLSEIDAGCRSDDWSKKTAIDVYGKKLGVIGLGHIGQGVVKRSTGFHMEVLAYDSYWDDAFASQYHVRKADIDTILKDCDFISLHLPLDQDTKHLIDERRLRLMKPKAVIINTARGGLIDEDALYRLLENKTIYGAGLDVFETEPASDTPFKTLKNVILGSHCAASTEGAVDLMGLIATQNLIDGFIKRGIVDG